MGYYATVNYIINVSKMDAAAAEQVITTSDHVDLDDLKKWAGKPAEDLTATDLVLEAVKYSHEEPQAGAGYPSGAGEFWVYGAGKYHESPELLTELSATGITIEETGSGDEDVVWVRHYIGGACLDRTAHIDDLTKMLQDALAPLVAALTTAANPATTGAELAALAAHEDARVRAAVARNAATPQDILLQLALDDDADVRAAIIANPATPATTATAAVLAND